MSTDNDLLELAAIAAGYETDWVLCVDDTHMLHVWGGDICMEWNPLTDDGDALRLAVKLGLTVEQWPDEDGQGPYAAIDPIIEHHDGDPYAATRRAIVRAAAETGRGME